jgi:hypothetical protein
MNYFEYYSELYYYNNPKEHPQNDYDDENCVVDFPDDKEKNERTQRTNI